MDGRMLLGGPNAEIDDGKVQVTSSKLAYLKLYPMVIDATERGDLEIEYLDSDR